METLAAPARYEQTIKRSRFLAEAAGCTDEAEAVEFVAAVSESDARHHCWAWKTGEIYRFGDAGEPAGTAGRPILQAIEYQGLDRVVVVVSRWFGGIKLGAGGLVRAYGGTAAECLRTARREALIELVEVVVSVPFEALSVTHRLAERFGAEGTREHYHPAGLSLVLRLPAARRAAFVKELSDATRGSATVGMP